MPALLDHLRIECRDLETTAQEIASALLTQALWSGMIGAEKSIVLQLHERFLWLVECHSPRSIPMLAYRNINLNSHASILRDVGFELIHRTDPIETAMHDGKNQGRTPKETTCNGGGYWAEVLSGYRTEALEISVTPNRQDWWPKLRYGSDKRVCSWLSHVLIATPSIDEWMIELGAKFGLRLRSLEDINESNARLACFGERQPYEPVLELFSRGTESDTTLEGLVIRVSDLGVEQKRLQREGFEISPITEYRRGNWFFCRLTHAGLIVIFCQIRERKNSIWKLLEDIHSTEVPWWEI